MPDWNKENSNPDYYNFGFTCALENNLLQLKSLKLEKKLNDRISGLLKILTKAFWIM